MFSIYYGNTRQHTLYSLLLFYNSYISFKFTLHDNKNNRLRCILRIKSNLLLTEFNNTADTIFLVNFAFCITYSILHCIHSYGYYSIW